ncbi:ROK family transcriptional regulator [Novosphingobium sp.]|uniref:ROK family transcriptional regulator n=1 Tax=Novosphingobium sp. TaxID=1874826 RepID=UPI0031D37FC6
MMPKPDMPALPAPLPFRMLSGNERLVLGLIRQLGPVSRAELARKTGLTIPSISRLAEALLKDGLILAEEKVMMGRMGQPSLPLVLAPQAAFAIGVAVRADSLTVTLSHLSGRVVAQIREAHENPAREAVEARIIALASNLLEAEGVSPRLCGIGIALSGFYLAGQQQINAPLGMEDWAIERLEALLQERMKVAVVIENDGNAATIGEYFQSGADYPASFAYLYIDRGLGGGVMLDGRLMRGSHGNAGEFTGMLPPEARAHRPTLELLRTMLAQDGLSFATISAMLEAYDDSWPATQRWLDTVTPATDAIVSAIGGVLDSQAIVIGGRIPPPLAERLAQRVGCYSVPLRGRDRPFPTIRAHMADVDAAAFGAGMMCFQRFLLD